MVQITCRIFADDLNMALRTKHYMRFHLGEKEETEAESPLLQKYIAERLKITINKNPQSLVFVSKELENNVLICYYKITDISKISSLTVTNEILFDYVTEQQNIIQTNVYGEKDSKLLTIDETAFTNKYQHPH
jgi:hypothetical protein